MRQRGLFFALVASVVMMSGTAIVLFRPERPTPPPPPPVTPLWTKPVPPWKKTEAKPPKNFEEQVKIGDAYYDRAQHEKAIGAYQQALAIRDSAYVRTNLGVSLHTLGRSDEALQQFARALELEPSYWKASFNELVIFANRKDYAKALARIERLRSLQKSNNEIPPLDDLERHLRSRANSPR